MKQITIYTDGACKGNPGPGGWAAILKHASATKEIIGSEESTTNNRMELQAVIEGLRALNQPCKVSLYTDSKYVKDGAESWLANWQRNNWKTANKKDVKNKDLWIDLAELLHAHTVIFFWVKGHNGDPLNERADELANLAISNTDEHKG